MENRRGCGYSEFYCNLPESPRKCDIDSSKLRGLLSEVFGENQEMISITNGIYRCQKLNGWDK